MKTKNLLLPLLILIALPLSSQYYNNNYLSINDPQRSTYYYFDGSIKEASLNIKPHGSYLEYDLYLTFHAMVSNSNYYYNSSPFDASTQLELTLDFVLPEKSFITDSWLWVGDSIMKALLLDKWTASAIYEGIVNRRKDPSVLYKNGTDHYQLRVYPIKTTMDRKVKISYMVPFTQGDKYVSAPLPIDIIKTSTKAIPKLKITVFPGSNHSNPMILEKPEIAFSSKGATYEATLDSAQLMGSTNISLNTNYKNGIYLNTVKVNNENFYQLAFIPSLVLEKQKNRRIAVVIDFDKLYSKHYYYDYNYGYYIDTIQKTTLTDMLDKTKNALLAQLRPNDSINIFSNVNSASNNSLTWVSVTPENITNLFEPLYTKLSQISKTSTLLQDAISFINKHDSIGSILLVSNADDFVTNITASNTVINDVMKIMPTQKIPIHIVDGNTNWYPYTLNSQHYYGNQYLYQTLSNMTLGSFNSIQSYHFNNYHYQDNTLDKSIMNAILQTEDRIPNFDYTFNLQTGFCHSRIYLSDNTKISYNNPIVQVGKFEGNPPFELKINAKIDTSIISKSYVITSLQMDSSQIKTHKIWAGNYILSMESQLNNNSSIAEIIDASLNNRVLSKYTAFLALEPSDSVHACSDCNEFSMNNDGDYGMFPVGIATSLQETNADSTIDSKTYPNPFTNNLTITINLSNISKTLTVQVYSIQGQLLNSIYSNNQFNEKSTTLTWNGNDEAGNALASGLYLIVITSDNGKKVMKVIKQ